MKHLALVLCLLVTVAFFSACKVFRPVEEPMPVLTDAATLWTYITVETPYTEWKPFENASGKLKGTPPHGNKIQIFPNQLARESVYKAENGSIIVMENYDCDGAELIYISAMYKRKGYAPSSGDWFWAMYLPDGTVIEEGKIKRCIDCHVSMAFDDYTFVHKW